ncbi:hypothetical protein C5167_048479 [Papaver somniferum]|uniref:Bet v I/Major latex protein domain-containing protein n=1 Tax=Papaver somniferum TaxID=3469 RepID=A0A4Y7KL00_PAPSO|nr:major latex protein 146-like [Papaver somniferum]RZC73000.1 hypothetical protein C5167_048479 [Papaver somniferum]
MAKVISMVQTFLRLGLLVLVLIGMTQIVGAQIETELKCSADKFYNVFRHNVMQLTTVLPQYFKSVKIVKGDGKSLGSIRQWQYVLQAPEASSKVLMLKETVTSVDEENRSITFSVVGGDILTHYKSVDFIMAVTPKYVNSIEESGSKVQWWVQYEKRTEDVGSPDGYVNLLALLTKEMGHYLLQQ